MQKTQPISIFETCICVQYIKKIIYTLLIFHIIAGRSHLFSIRKDSKNKMYYNLIGAVVLVKIFNNFHFQFIYYHKIQFYLIVNINYNFV